MAVAWGKIDLFIRDDDVDLGRAAAHRGGIGRAFDGELVFPFHGDVHQQCAGGDDPLAADGAVAYFDISSFFPLGAGSAGRRDDVVEIEVGIFQPLGVLDEDPRRVFRRLLLGGELFEVGHGSW